MDVHRFESWEGDALSEAPRDLERHQSGLVEKRRSEEEGKDAPLTELAVAPPVSDKPRPNSFERVENAARKSSQRDPSVNSDDGFLTEIVAPPPVDDHEDSKATGYTDSTGPGPSLEQGSDDEGHQSTAIEDKENDSPQPEPKSLQAWTEFVTIAWLIFFSLLGTLARLGVEAITTYPYAPFASTVLWANMGGSFFLGFLLEDRRLFRFTEETRQLSGDKKEEAHQRIDKRKKVLPLYIGLATGFCGSFTSYSTFILDAFLALSNRLTPASPTSPYHEINPQMIQSRNGGYSFMAVLAIIIIHPAVAISALEAGAHLAVGLECWLPSLPAHFITRYLDPLAVLLGLGSWIGAILLSIWPVNHNWRGRATMALVFAPLGVLLRFYLSRHLNARILGFPLGTLLVNILGTCILGMCYDLQHTRVIVGSVASGRANSCAVLDGVMQGFCGCATTVSTWVAELNGLRRRHAWFYGLSSISVALAFQVAIMGSVAWTTGFDDRCAVRV
ncbi:hypothetical protein LTR70_010232 [Exophiala xenobiotica]|uniref:Uncharacterized protein n=1 Tax=Lithohypha guttulata TaxID=1690604 RepID=A0ABR0JUI2_9EURO|nr:hypothetical protein LTR24_010240 [Lithohypha guttulata]KAK5309500.1 hypothetical protein LTR70_010232 [Exophiala xenobiotica]